MTKGLDSEVKGEGDGNDYQPNTNWQEKRGNLKYVRFISSLTFDSFSDTSNLSTQKMR